MKKNKAFNRIIYHTLVIAFGYIMIYPILWMVFASFKDNNEIFQSAGTLIPNHFRFENFANGWKGFGGTTFSVFFRNSFIISILSTIGAVA